MFCPKCGTKVPDGAGFCQKCGTKLAADTQLTEPSPAATAQQLNSFQEKSPKKKKFKKLPIILGAVALFTVLAIVIGVNFSGKIDYISTAKEHQPFAVDQDPPYKNFPYTFGEVLDKYLSSPLWYVDSEDEKTDGANVKVEGIIKGTEHNFWLIINVTPKPDGSDGCHIVLQSISFDGIESSNQDDMANFLYHMFAAYDEGYKDLSELLSDAGSLGQQREIELTEVYANTDAGISFRYPSNWVIIEESDLMIVNMIDSDNASGHRVMLQVLDTLGVVPFNLFSGDTASIEMAVNEIHTFLSVEDDTISGVSARMLKYRTEGLGGDEIVQCYYYVNGDNTYLVQCSCSESIADTYEKVFEAIMDSYTITPMEAAAPSQDIDNSIDDYYESPYPDGMNYALEEVMKSEIAGYYGGVMGQSTADINIYSEPGENWECGHISLYVDSERPVYGGLSFEGELMEFDTNLYYVWHSGDESILLGIDRDDYGVSMELYIDNTYVETYFMQEHYTE